MSAATSPIASGKRYAVSKVDGRSPTQLRDCIGPCVLTLTDDDHVEHIAGTGVFHLHGVRFRAEQPDVDGDDVRVWFISQPARALIAEDMAGS